MEVCNLPKLHQLTSIPICFSQRSGIFIFQKHKSFPVTLVVNSEQGENTCNKKSIKTAPAPISYFFRWRSYPVLFAIARSLISILNTIHYYASVKERLYGQFDSDPQSNQAEIQRKNGIFIVSEIMLIFSVPLLDFLLNLMQLSEKKNILCFLNQLEESFQGNVKESGQLEKKCLESWLNRTVSKLRNKIRAVNHAWIVGMIFMFNEEIRNVFTGSFQFGGKFEFISLLDELLYPMYFVVWLNLLYSRLHSPILLSALMKSLHFGFLTLTGSILQSNSMCLWEDELVRRLVENYEDMESLVEEFNKVFGPHLLLQTGSIVTIVLVQLFHLFGVVSSIWNITLRSGLFAVQVCVYLVVLFELFTAATEMAVEVRHTKNNL